MEPIADVQFIQGDFREEEVLTQLDVVLAGRKVDVVLSDMAPNLSGIRPCRRRPHGTSDRSGDRILAVHI